MSSLTKQILGDQTPDPESIIAGVRMLVPGQDSLPLDQAVTKLIADKDAQIAALTAQLETKPPVTPTTPPVTPPVTPSAGFTDRSVVDAAKWKVALEDDFKVLAAEKQFFNVYKDKWDTYDANAQSTDKKGVYDRDKISVVDLPTGERVCQSRLSPKSKNASGKPSGTLMMPKLNGNAYNGTQGEKVEVRMQITKSAAGYHIVPLTWPLDAWPANGELDYLEIDLNADGSGTIGAYLHVQNGGSNGEGQVKLTSTIKRDGWFTIGYERIPGERFDWIINGKVIKSVTKADLKAPYGIPTGKHRQVLQFEPKGTSQTDEALVSVDWFCLWTPAG